MRKASLVGFMTVALLQGCAGTGRRRKPVPWTGTPWPPLARCRVPQPCRRSTVSAVSSRKPLRGITKVDLIGVSANKNQPRDDLWARIRQGFAMPDLDNALVRRKTREYAASSDYLQRMFERSRIYL